jgi:RNA-binding protein YhbY
LNNIKKNVVYLNLKSFSSENKFTQFNFWFDVDKKSLDSLLKEIKKITSENKLIKVQIFSRSGIYE